MKVHFGDDNRISPTTDEYSHETHEKTRNIVVRFHDVVDDPDSLHGTCAGIRVVIDIDDNIGEVLMNDHTAVGMVLAPGSRFAIDLDVFSPL
jgi:hypothetical protein